MTEEERKENREAGEAQSVFTIIETNLPWQFGVLERTRSPEANSPEDRSVGEESRSGSKREDDLDRKRFSTRIGYGSRDQLEKKKSSESCYRTRRKKKKPLLGTKKSWLDRYLNQDKTYTVARAASSQRRRSNRTSPHYIS